MFHIDKNINFHHYLAFNSFRFTPYFAHALPKIKQFPLLVFKYIQANESLRLKFSLYATLITYLHPVILVIPLNEWTRAHSSGK